MSKIYKQMMSVMKEIGPVTKDQKNTAQGFKFRGIDQFVNALHPALVKHGVFMAPRCVKEVHELKEVMRSSGKPGIDKHVSLLMEYDFYAEDGSKVTVGPIPAEGLDSGDKATNKALSAALKYALIQTFSVPTEDMAEADLETPVIGTAPTTKLKQLDSSGTLTAKSPEGLTTINSEAAAPPQAVASNVGSSPGASPSAPDASSAASSAAPRRSSFRRPTSVNTKAALTTETKLMPDKSALATNNPVTDDWG